MTLGQRAATTDAGRKRRRNEDAYVVEPPLFAVADGMGGAQAGELASSLAAAALRDDVSEGGGEERVAELIQQANRRVYERSSEDEAAAGMGTTMTVALVEEALVTIGHVGDSRAYLIRDGKLEQLTDDHSLVAELVRSGKLSPEEAETHPQRSVITRALGTDPDVDVDTFTIGTRPGDIFLLCSDGLTSMVDDERILTEVARHHDDLNTAAKALVSAANRGGGEDNITIIFFEITDEEVELEETATMPAPVEGNGAPDDETLDELDLVPAVDTMVVRPEDAEKVAAEAEDRKPRRRLGRTIALLVLLAALLAVAAIVLWTLR